MECTQFEDIPDEIVLDMVESSPDLLNPLIRTSKRYQNLLTDHALNVKERLIDHVIGYDDDLDDLLYKLRDFLLYTDKGGEERYYYLYYDNPDTEYYMLSDLDRLMNLNAICIKAHSQGEVNILACILSILLDRSMGILSEIIDSSYLLDRDMYSSIINNAFLDRYYNNYSDRNIRPFDRREDGYRYEEIGNGLRRSYAVYTSAHGDISININTPLVFDRYRVLKLLSNRELLKYYETPLIKNDHHLDIILEMTEMEQNTRYIEYN